MNGSTARFVFGTMVVSVALWGADPFLGSWKLNLEKSRYGSVSLPKSETWTCVAQKGGALKWTRDGVSAQGQPSHVEYTSKTDGRDYPVTGAASYDAVSWRQIDSHTRDYARKKAGQPAGSGRLTVSKDGRTMTATWSGNDRDGKPITVTGVYDRQ